jgi:prevent-host-death family protein
VRQVTIHHAKTQLSKLIEAAMAGEEIVIAKGDKPMVRLVPVAKGAFKFGVLEGRVGDGPDFLAPMSEEELSDWEGRR